jgi:pSer/pThr/pTyr-binding forkhead associated (FHA) protein
MSRNTPIPTPVGPFGLDAPAGTTDPLKPLDTDTELDALPLLDYRLRAQTIPPAHAIRGAYLVLHDGDDARLLRLDRDITHLGRGSVADVRFEDYRVSRDHAILVRHGRYFRLLDNRSANGTLVDGHRITATNLSSGDVIDLGPVRLEFLEID